MQRILLIPRIKIQNANALSSPYTIGFPAMTAWLGAMHALQRHLNDEFPSLEFKALAVVSHSCDLQIQEGYYINSIIGTANPLQRNNKTGEFERPPFIEEARCHLEVSLVIEYSGVEADDNEKLCATIKKKLRQKMKIAGGDILNVGRGKLDVSAEKIIDDADLRKLSRRLMPGYVLVERRDLMLKEMQQGEDALDTLLSYLSIRNFSEKIGDEVVWKRERKTSGWVIPIATGFHGISELGTAKNQRDSSIQHRFAESVVTLGEFIMPYRIENLDNMLWEYKFYEEKGLYLCQQKEHIN